MTFNFAPLRSIKTRIALLMLAIFVGSVWLLAFYVSRNLRHDMQQTLGQQQLAIASLLATEINHHLADHLQTLEISAKSLQPAFSGKVSAMQAALNNRPLLLSAFNGGAVVVDTRGSVIAEVPALGRLGDNYLAHDHIAAALKGAQATIGKPLRGNILQAPLLAMAVPIRNAQGEVIGAISGVTLLNQANFLDPISSAGFGRTGAYLLVAPQHGLVVTSSIKSRILAELPPPGANPLVDRNRGGFEGTTIAVDPLGDEVLTSVKRVPVAGWLVAVRMTTAEAFAPIAALQRSLLLATLAMTLFMALLTWWLLRRQFAPLLSSVQTMARMTNGQVPMQALPVQQDDEVGRLVQGFNQVLAKLQQGDALRQRVLDTASVAIFLIDKDKHIQQANQRMAEMFGCPLLALQGSDYLELVHPDERAPAQQNTIALIASALPAVDLDRRYLRADQSAFWGHLTCRSYVENDNGEPMLVCVIADITERKEQQQHWQLAQRVFAQAHEGILVTDAAANVLMVNQAYTDITGYSQDETVGKNPRILQSGRQDQRFYQLMWKALTTEGQWSGEIWNKKKDGTIYPEWLAISALHDAKGLTTHYVANFTDLSLAKATEQRLQWLSNFDPLTGLPNRTLLQDRARQTLSMVQRASQPLAVLLVSMDHFGSINEMVGHQLGDQILVEVAQRLIRLVREQDTVSRLAGKEFVLVLPGTDETGAAHLADELLTELARPFQLQTQEISTTVSIGIACYPDDGADFDALFKAVEIAMRLAQNDGRNRFRFFSAELYEKAHVCELMTRALRQAAALEQLHLVYQPQVDLHSGKMCGMEALLRWNHPEMGAVSPVQFIPLAEQAGLIVEIGQWVLRRACCDIRRWRDAGLLVPTVSVNVSPLQFRNNDLPAQVSAALGDAQVEAGLLYIEVTESALMDDVPHNETILRELKALGVKLSLDDFGTGYSALSYLKRFPFNQIKVDQSFVRDITSSTSDQMLVKVIVSMAHGFGMRAIAEGVETEAQRDLICSSLCDEMQGYLFSRPLDFAAMQALLTQRDR